MHGAWYADGMAVSDLVPSRRILLFAATLLSIGLALYGARTLWAAFAPESSEASESSTMASASPPPATVGSIASAEPSMEPPAEPLDEPPLDHPALRRYAELNRYSDSSRRIDEDSFDLLEPNARYEDWQPLSGSDGGGPRFSVFFTADRYAIRGDETARIRFSLRRDGVEVPVRGFSLHVAPIGPMLDDADRDPVRLDAERSGLSRQAELDPDSLWPDHVGRVVATARFSAEGLDDQSGTLAFQVTPSSRIPARFDGRFTDRLRAGDLVVDVGLQVDTEGVYRIEGNLYDGYGAPVAWARFQGALEPGLRTAPVVFDGLILHDAGARGPFSLRQLRGYRMRPADVPHKEDLRDWPSPHELEGDYLLSDFSRRAAGEPARRTDGGADA